ncbi:MAG: YlxR family protein [Clostridia bacterium]|nr:YlxR family protein [Clostridia bacterium]
MAQLKPKKIPMRMCVSCREKKPKKELIRVVRSPEGEVSLDPTGRKNGRGAYLCANPECFKKAGKTHALDRALEVRLDESVLDGLARQLQDLAESGR